MHSIKYKLLLVNKLYELFGKTIVIIERTLILTTITSRYGIINLDFNRYWYSNVNEALSETIAKKTDNFGKKNNTLEFLRKIKIVT